MLRFLSILALCSADIMAQMVSGTVLDATTNTGVAGVAVELKETGTTIYNTTTDALGRFTFDNVKNGAYTAYYSKSGYFSSPSPQYIHKAFQLTPSVPSVSLEARMIQAGTITGHVIDGKGHAVPNAQVELVGSRTAIKLNADSNGKFQRELYPDSFLLSATPPLSLKSPETEPGDDRAWNWTKTYYPYTPAQETASRVALHPGETLDIELKLLALPAHAIRGVLLMPDGSPVPHAMITLGENLIPLSLPRFKAESNADGTFEFTAILDGPWRLGGNTTDSEGNPLRLIDWVEMARHDLEGLKLRFEAPFTVRGKIILEDGDETPGTKFPPIALQFRGRNAPSNAFGVISSPVAFPDAERRFSLKGVYPGDYGIVFSDPPWPYYLDSIRIDGVEVSPRHVKLDGPSPMTLVYKTNGGTLRGTCGPGRVLLLPQDPVQQWPGFLRFVQCDAASKYELRAVRPGDYYVLQPDSGVGSSRVDLQACKLEYSIVSPK